MRIDASDLLRNLDADRKANEQLIIDKVSKVTLDAHADLVRATPVDTGQARQGWEVTTPTTVDQPGIIENNVEHIVYLNDGHSKQAPDGFVDTIVQNYNGGA